jgi:hypothetical protein
MNGSWILRESQKAVGLIQLDQPLDLTARTQSQWSNDWTKPVQSAYKRSWRPVHLIFPFVSLSSLRVLSFSLLLTLTLAAPFMAFTHQTWFWIMNYESTHKSNIEWMRNTSILLFFWRKLFEPFDFDFFREQEFETFRSTRSLKTSVQNVSIYMFLQVWFRILLLFRVSTFFSKNFWIKTLIRTTFFIIHGFETQLMK